MTPRILPRKLFDVFFIKNLRHRLVLSYRPVLSFLFPVFIGLCPFMTTAIATTVRSYRYALQPTKVQRQALVHASDRSRREWNELVKLAAWAENEQRFGRREALIHRFGHLLAGKALVGRATSQARALMEEHGFSTESEAIAFARAARVEKVRQQDKHFLTVQYAIERARSNFAKKRTPSGSKKKECGLSRKTFEATVRRFEEASAQYCKGQRGRPRLKKQTDSVGLQWQLDPRCVNPVDFERGTVDIAAMIGSPCCQIMRVTFHRDLPPGAWIKQLAVKFTPTRVFLVIGIEAPSTSLQRRVPRVPPSAVAGIDPGRGTALTISDVHGNVQFNIRPPVLRDETFSRKTRRWYRLATRQMQRANPHRFDEKTGCWKRGSAPVVRTAGLRATHLKIAKALRHLTDARREVYHLAANRLLREFAVVGVGPWRGQGKAFGIGATRRGQNRKDHDNAVSEFVNLLRDKARRSLPSRQVLDIDETHTTRCCVDCGEATGPHGIKGLKVRVWTCVSCGQIHQRDFASARAIARRTLAQTAAGAQPVQPERVFFSSKKQARNPAASFTKASVRRGAHAKIPLTRKIVSEPERRSGGSAALPACRPEAVGVQSALKPAACSHSPKWLQPDLPFGLQDTPCIHAVKLPQRRHRRRECAGTVTRPSKTQIGDAQDCSKLQPPKRQP